jgi:hypothetical protein
MFAGTVAHQQRAIASMRIEPLSSAKIKFPRGFFWFQRESIVAITQQLKFFLQILGFEQSFRNSQDGSEPKWRMSNSQNLSAPVRFAQTAVVPERWVSACETVDNLPHDIV